MKDSLHYLLMTDHLLFQKFLLSGIKDTGLTLGQPKVLDYLHSHDGAMQKDIADACHIEPATLTSLLSGMEKKGLILRKNENGNRRSLYVYLTPKGQEMAQEVDFHFQAIEETALAGFNPEEKELLTAFLSKINKNMKEHLS